MWRAARSVWAEPAVASPPARAGRDRLLAAIVLGAVLIEAVTRDGGPGRQLVAVGLGCTLAVAVLVRRRWHLAAVALAFGPFVVADVVAVVLGVEPVALDSGLVVLVCVYSLLRWGAGRDVVLGMAVVAMAYTVSVATNPDGPDNAIGGAAVLLSAAALGAAIRYRAVARDRLVEQVKLQERAQLARELHDTIAHHVSAIAIQAQAGLVMARSPSHTGATEALEVIDREAGRTLAEMRAMVGSLRDLGDRVGLDPRLADIEQLAAAGAGSLRVDVELRGDLTDLTPVWERTLYRVAQESVTNARRHAPLATRVRVTVLGNAADVSLTVRDDGAPTPDPGPRGYGLVGMTERVTLLGGTLDAGPGPDRGWCVRAVLPRPRSAT